MKKMFVLLLLVICLSALSVSVMGDVLPGHYTGVKYCIIIENQNDYPNYIFAIGYHSASSPEAIAPGDCIELGTVVYAFDKSNLSNIIKSVLQLKNYEYSYDKPNLLEEARTILKIDSLNNKELLIHEEKFVYVYSNGTTEELKYDSQKDKDSYHHVNYRDLIELQKLQKPQWTNTVLFLGGGVISLAALITIIVILIKRFRK